MYICVCVYKCVFVCASERLKEKEKKERGAHFLSKPIKMQTSENSQNNLFGNKTNWIFL